MTIRYRDIQTPDVPSNPLHNLARGLRIGKEYPVRNVSNAQDTIFGHGRRVLLREGLKMSGAFAVPNGTPPGTGQYPDQAAREIARVKAKLTPGHYLAWTVLSLPSGPTEEQIAPFNYLGLFGQYRLTVTWVGPVATVVTTHTLEPTTSTQTNGGEAQAPSSNWSKIERLADSDVFPAPNANFDITELLKWSQAVEVELLLEYLGACRPVDICVYERPIRFAADTDTDDLPTPCHTTGGSAKVQLSSPYPVEQFSLTDPSQGSKQVLVSAQLQMRIGPHFGNVSSHNEANASFPKAPPPWSRVAATFAELRVPVALAGAALANRPGASVSSGSTCQLVRVSGRVEMREVNAAVPVCARVYAQGEGVVRVKGNDYSEINLVVNSPGVYAWVEATGFLRCGIYADDASWFEAWFAATGGGQIDVRYLSVEYEENKP